MAILTTGRGEGPRRYYDEDKPDIRYPSVTSITGMLPKDLSYWNALEAAKLACDSAPYLQSMVDRDRDGTVKFLAGSARRYSDQRANLGSAAHDAFERMIKGERVGRVDDAVMPYLHQFDAWMKSARPELYRAEDLAWSDEHGFAGSFDLAAYVRIDPETHKVDPQGEKRLLMIDYKTGKRVYEEVALQLTAYASAETLIDGNTWERLPMPTFDGGAVLHVGADFYDFINVKLSADIFETFLSCLHFFHAVQGWNGSGRGRNRIEGVKDNVLRASFDSSGVGMVTGTQRRG